MSKIGRFLLVLSFLVPFVLVACTGQQATPVATVTSSPPTKAIPAPTTAKQAWEVAWDKAVAEGKKEGKVVVCSTAGAEARKVMTEGFKQAYGITVEFISGKGSEMLVKLQNERRAGLYLADIYLAGSTTQINDMKPTGMIDPLKPVLLLPEVADTKYWIGGKHLWADTEKQYILGFRYGVTTQICINTDLVKPGEIETCRDLLNPKWKGQIVMLDPTKPGTAERFMATTLENPKLGANFLRNLAKQELEILRDERLAAEWIARGKKAIGIGVKEDLIADMRQAGAPVKNNPPSDNPIIAAGSSNISLINKAPHPNAAVVFINWLLGKEGQTLYSQALLLPSARADVPVPKGIDPVSAPQPGVDYFYTDSEEFLLGAREREKIAKEIFGPLMK